MFNKFNWGHGLTLFIILFMSGMMYLVSLCFKQDFDLVSTDYYEKEIAYQQQIDRSNNAAALSAPVQFLFDKSSSTIQIQFPKEYEAENLSVHAFLYKPDNAKLDKTIELVATQAQALVQASDLKTGLWRIQLNWTKDNKDYFTESSIYIH